MIKRKGALSFKEQMKQSMNDLRGIMARGESPTGNGRFTARTVTIAEPSIYSAREIRRARNALGISQVLFAGLLGVSAALVRAWELGTRLPNPMARRLLDQLSANPEAFSSLVQTSSAPKPRKVA